MTRATPFLTRLPNWLIRANRPPMTEIDDAPPQVINGQFGGCPPGSLHADKTTYPADQLIEATAEAIMQGKRSPVNLPKAGPVTDEDKRAITRMSGIPAEEFAAKLTARLQFLAEKTGDRVAEKLEADAYKPGELTLLLAVTIDKLTTLGNRSANTGSQVGVQINVFGQNVDRKSMLAQLKGQTVDRAIDVSSSIPSS